MGDQKITSEYAVTRPGELQIPTTPYPEGKAASRLICSPVMGW